MINQELEKIIEMVINKKTNVQIAYEMGYSVETVKNRLKKIYKHYKTQNRVGLLIKLLESKQP